MSDLINAYEILNSVKPKYFQTKEEFTKETINLAIKKIKIITTPKKITKRKKGGSNTIIIY